MDFFQSQEEAQKASRLLVIYFLLAVIAIVLSVHLAASAALYWVQASTYQAFDWWRIDRLVLFAGGALLIILTGSLYKIWWLSDGGHAVAAMLGGRPLEPGTNDLGERRLLNVVEEMAIASGVPVPSVYLLDREESINAFAAGFAPQDAVLGVTRGTIDLLDRDELQGVIAHEFSHVLNGDMRLNIRLMGVLHGILVIALIGYFVLRSSVVRSSSRKRGGGGAALVPLVGLALVVIGYIGVFFGRVIKSAVSRQREFLADASAVQFTRNPHGIAGALKKIGGLVAGSTIMSPHAEQASHFFFSDSKYGKVRQALSGLSHFDFLSTHPPLRERVRRIDRSWDGTFPEVTPSKDMAREPAPTSRPSAPPELFRLLPAQLIALVGTLDRDHLAYARALLDSIPQRTREAVHDPSGARGVVLAILASRDEAIRRSQLADLEEAADTALVEETRAVLPLLDDAPRKSRLPLVDLAVASLRRLSPAQYRQFMNLVDVFIRADRQVDLFEFTLTHVLKRHLKPAFEKTRPPAVSLYGLGSLRPQCSMLLSAVAHAGQRDEAEARKAFAVGAGELRDVSLSFVPRTDAGLSGVRDALEKLEPISAKLKKDLMRAVIATVAHDAKVTVSEGELIRAIADALALPLPPFLPGQKLESQPASPAQGESESSAAGTRAAP